MAVPVAPAAGEPIAEAWGDVVHDSIVAMDIQTGVVTLNWTASSLSATGTVVFPRPFAAPPIVVTAGNQAYIGGLAGTPVSATQFQCNGRERAGTSTTMSHPMYWIAYGPRA